MRTLKELKELSQNLWWSWNPDAIALFRDIDPALWRQVNHNPIAFLALVPEATVEARAVALALETRISFACHRLREYLQGRQSWGKTFGGPLRARPVAYFSAEFGLHESLPIYSGGLGVLAGDHLKSASDLDLPLVGVGLFYAQGYFNQEVDRDGWQHEQYDRTPIDRLPLSRATGADGSLLRVEVHTRSQCIRLQVWRAAVGRVTLILLDSDIDENSADCRALTGRLYGGTPETRIRQELILGVGGLRALRALGILPGVLHLNEGHSAFAVLEAVRLEMVRDAVPFALAAKRVRRQTVFTTHTPEAAGHDRFDGQLIEEVLGPLRDELGLARNDLMRLGRVDADHSQEPFCMTVLALKSAARTNAVSGLHRHVSRGMWQDMWPGRAESEVPIGQITNGVHVASWLAPPMNELYDRYLPGDWRQRLCEPQTWAPISDIDDEELWEVRQILKARLIAYVQRQVCDQEAARQEQAGACALTLQRLDPTALTIGFARRFATYKRSSLLFSDVARLQRLISDATRPIQIILAGKAHPQDQPGKELIQRIFHLSRQPAFLGRVVFLEDYDVNVARHLVQGVDVWLNTPRRPREACGTSGMKAVFNGAVNVSVLDGWWAEVYDGSNGFAIGDGGEHLDTTVQDGRDAAALYELLERSVIALYYDVDANGLPRRWIACMKHSIRSLAWRLSANRMVLDYARECYLPAVGLTT